MSTYQSSNPFASSQHDRKRPITLTRLFTVLPPLEACVLWAMLQTEKLFRDAGCVTPIWFNCHSADIWEWFCGNLRYIDNKRATAALVKKKLITIAGDPNGADRQVKIDYDRFRRRIARGPRFL